MNVFSVVDMYWEDEQEVSIAKQLFVETLVAVMINFDSEDIGEYEETIFALEGMGS